MLVWSVKFDLIVSKVSRLIFGLIRCAGDKSPPDIWIARRPWLPPKMFNFAQIQSGDSWAFGNPSLESKKSFINWWCRTFVSGLDLVQVGAVQSTVFMLRNLEMTTAICCGGEKLCLVWPSCHFCLTGSAPDLRQQEVQTVLHSRHYIRG